MTREVDNLEVDNRTVAEKQRDAQEPPKAIVERISLGEALRRKHELEAREKATSLAAPNDTTTNVPGQGVGYGVPPELIAAARAHDLAAGRVPSDSGPAVSSPQEPSMSWDKAGFLRRLPVADPLTLIDQARNVADSLDKFASNLLGAADWCQARAEQLPPLERQALLHAAEIMRRDSTKCAIEKAPAEYCPD